MYSNPAKVKAVHDLAPEQQKALAVLLNNLPKTSELFLQSDFPASKFCITGFMAFSNKPLPKLPHEETWIWNQSNGKVTVKTDGGNFVTIQKLNKRKKKNCQKPPSYKVWVCYVSRSMQQPHYLNFIWCEKGVPSKDSSSSGSPDSNRSESSDGSSENTSPDSFYHQSFEQNSPPDESFNPRRFSSPCLPVQTSLQIKFSSNNTSNLASYPSIYAPSTTLAVSSPINHSSPISTPNGDSPTTIGTISTSSPTTTCLPSLETLVFLRNGKEVSFTGSRKRSLPQISPHMSKKVKLDHPPNTNFSLPPLRIPPSTSCTTNGFSTLEVPKSKEKKQHSTHNGFNRVNGTKNHSSSS